MIKTIYNIISLYKVIMVNELYLNTHGIILYIIFIISIYDKIYFYKTFHVALFTFLQRWYASKPQNF